ncbi:MAG TPA: HAMP domain-containing sensor histidine kinase [Candidatus Dormibacteraeota bacterium]|nr:HAMP domain-containing sensor histidine kinase [Candidatus Dormibacteraeota bacterium]
MAEPRTPVPGAARPMSYRMSYKMYLFLAIVALMAALVLHSNFLISRLNAETQTLCTVLARFFAVSTFRAAEDPTLRPIFREVVGSINFPIILTDTRSIPRAWKLIGIEPSAVPDSLLQQAAQTGVVPPVVKRIQEKARELDRRHAPIKVERLGNPGILGYVHYGEPPLVSQLRWVPYIEFAVILALLVFGFVGFRTLMTGEQRSLWAALAKETAHQLGTPLSSLHGWSAHLREAAAEQPPAPERLEAIAGEIDLDLERLNKIASRFGQVGSIPVLREGDLTETVAGVARYFRHRLPHLGRETQIVERYEPVPKVAFHPELMGWVVENLIRNAIDAGDKDHGEIVISTVWVPERHEVEIRVRDNGRGMTASERRKAFTPGFTTKRRGWGLGLALARRVVHEYHRGRIAIVESVPGQGTTVCVALPVAPSPRMTGVT